MILIENIEKTNRNFQYQRKILAVIQKEKQIRFIFVEVEEKKKSFKG